MLRPPPALVRSASLLATLLLMTAAPLQAQPQYPGDPFRFVYWTVDDARTLTTRTIPRHALYIAGAGGALLLLSPADRSVTEQVSEIEAGFGWRFVEEFGNVRAVRPAALALFAGSLMTDNVRFQDAAFTSLQAVIYANLITNGLKLVFGRARPFQEQGPADFRPFSGNSSFPSGHSTTAFAVLTPWMLYYPNLRTAGLVVLAGHTAFSRMVTNFHWLTDIVAGSGIGFATAYFLTRQHQRAQAGLQIQPTLGFNHLGVQVRF
ncbi:MAG: phosphatase PAP2 family protein [Bacteroidota bacterium]